MATQTFSEIVELGEFNGSGFGELVSGAPGTAILTAASSTLTVNETVDLQLNGQDFSTAI